MSVSFPPWESRQDGGVNDLRVFEKKKNLKIRVVKEVMTGNNSSHGHSTTLNVNYKRRGMTEYEFPFVDELQSVIAD